MAITAAKFQPYALAIGQMTLAWNELHESLGALFSQSLASDKNRQFQGSAIWGVVSSDRQKRLILDAAINCVGGAIHKQFPHLAHDVIWVIERANSLEDKRNNGIHSPLGEMSSPLVSALTRIPMGDVHPGGSFNERAFKLSRSTIYCGKDLLGEIVLYRDYAEMLSIFSDEIFTAWRKPSEAWPERPALPPLKDKG